MIESYEARIKMCKEMAQIPRQIQGVVGIYVEGPFHDEKSDIDMGVIYDENIISKDKAEDLVHKLQKMA